MEVDFIGVPPRYMSEGAAGADLACHTYREIQPNEEVLVKTGTKVKIPEGHFGMLVPRSSTCRKLNLELTNSVGIIDEDYTGELIFSYRNVGSEVVRMHAGDRIGQLVILPYVRAEFYPGEELAETSRGEGGFGSTGE